jgi:NitT/TauT family transport system substrate-binding protein
VVPVEAPYKNPADLKGQQIAGLSTTCCAVILIRGTSRNQYDTDFELVTLVPGVAIAVLGAGQVKSAILKEPFVSLTLISKNAQGQLRYKTLEAIAEDGADQLTLSNSMADDIVDIAAKYVTIDRQAIINSNPKLGFTTRLAMET